MSRCLFFSFSLSLCRDGKKKKKSGRQARLTETSSQALLKRYEFLTEDAESVGFFKGERVYRREDVEILRGERQWKRYGRAVRKDEEPTKDKLFAEAQTEPWEVPEIREDRIPVNDYGNVDVVDGDASLVPKGGVWIRGKDAIDVAKKIGKDTLPYAVVVVGFENAPNSSKEGPGSSSRRLFSSGASGRSDTASFQRPPKPKRDGVVVPERHAPNLRAAVDALRKTRAERKRHLKRERWATIVRKLLSRARLREMYLDNRRQ
mmetsp:Transcript_20722/g.66699  ORF Transcript_20722/g.66699 Transcript_20722/m.66699 type:complete len:262 (+) Transcript_20722:1045-1830(+)